VVFEPLRPKAARQSRGVLAKGLKQSILLKNRRTDAAAWVGWVGLLWMTGYWATLIPAWVYCNVVVFSTR
jgi:hypothetical protein